MEKKYYPLAAGVALTATAGLTFMALHGSAVNEAFDAKPGCQSSLDAFREAQDNLPSNADYYIAAERNYFGSTCPVGYGEALQHYGANTYAALAFTALGATLSVVSGLYLKREAQLQSGHTG